MKAYTLSSLLVQVCNEAAEVERVEQLLDEFAAAASQCLLFNRHVREISVLVIEPGATRAELQCSLKAMQRPRAAAGGQAADLEVASFYGSSSERPMVHDWWIKVEVSNPDNVQEVAVAAALLREAAPSGTPPALDGKLYCYMPVRSGVAGFGWEPHTRRSFPCATVTTLTGVTRRAPGCMKLWRVAPSRFNRTDDLECQIPCRLLLERLPIFYYPSVKSW